MAEGAKPISGRSRLKPGDSHFVGVARICPADRCHFGQLGAMILKMLADHVIERGASLIGCQRGLNQAAILLDDGDDTLVGHGEFDPLLDRKSVV
jgi:hypothetical protein